MASDPQAERFGYVDGEKRIDSSTVSLAGQTTREPCPVCGETLRQWIEPYNVHVFCLAGHYDRDGYAHDAG